MTPSKSDKWKQAGMQLATYKKAQVRCPSCEIDFLKSKDVFSEIDTNKFERLIYCELCGAKNYILMLWDPEKESK